MTANNRHQQKPATNQSIRERISNFFGGTKPTTTLSIGTSTRDRSTLSSSATTGGTRPTTPTRGAIGGLKTITSLEDAHKWNSGLGGGNGKVAVTVPGAKEASGGVIIPGGKGKLSTFINQGYITTNNSGLRSRTGSTNTTISQGVTLEQYNKARNSMLDGYNQNSGENARASRDAEIMIAWHKQQSNRQQSPMPVLPPTTNLSNDGSDDFEVIVKDLTSLIGSLLLVAIRCNK